MSKQKPFFYFNLVFIIFHWILYIFPGIGPVIRTTDHVSFQQKLASISISGGNDCPEMSVGGILKALELSRPNSYIYVFTDASAKDYHLANQVLSLIQRKQSQVDS
jgi:hemicentin